MLLRADMGHLRVTAYGVHEYPGSGSLGVKNENGLGLMHRL